MTVGVVLGRPFRMVEVLMFMSDLAFIRARAVIAVDTLNCSWSYLTRYWHFTQSLKHDDGSTGWLIMSLIFVTPD